MRCAGVLRVSSPEWPGSITILGREWQRAESGVELNALAFYATYIQPFDLTAGCDRHDACEQGPCRHRGSVRLTIGLSDWIENDSPGQRRDLMAAKIAEAVELMTMTAPP